MFQLRFKDNTQAPYNLAEKLCTIGRGVGNMIVLPTSTVSESHAKLIQHDGRLFLQDNKSAYGSYVNGTKVKYKQLKPGDVITLGNIHFDVLEVDATSFAATQTPQAKPLPQAYVSDAWQLVSDSSWLAGKVFHLKGDKMILGRGRDCDIVIPGTHLSRRHAEIRRQSGSLLLQDLGSSNGSYVNEVKVQGQQIVRAGDRLRFDVYSFRVQGPAGTGAYPSETSGPRRIDLSNTSSTLQNIEALKAQEYQPKEWITKPTSHGNRYHEVPSRKGHSVALWLSMALGLGVLGVLIYIIMSL